MKKKPTEQAPIVGDRVQFVRGDLVRAAVVVRVHDVATINLHAFVDGDVAPVWEERVMFESEARRHNAQQVGFAVEAHWRWPR